jgi:hypothetical protein
MRSVLVLFAVLFAAGVQAGQCTARSGERTAALVELYTSEGCSSCPPADRWLSALGARYPASRVVPLALHVDYWDYIGWKDPYGKRAFSSRQRKLTQLQKNALVYTPQVLLQGRDFRAWSGRGFDEAVERINARPAAARLALEIASAPEQALEVQAAAELLGGDTKPADVGLYLASYENRLLSRVQVGENQGRTLSHDYVVLEWQGPIEVPAAGRLVARRSLPLLPRAVAAHSGVVAFLQNRRTAEVLQALMLPACPD